ncbi:hypothetical protein [Reyranella sp.]|uniref:hypothetical protein n=1 Tax=Reyranella sp. TaxID=1929291 RepID=UPI003D110E16
MSAKADIPEGAVAYREYKVTFGGESGSITITLGQPDADTMPGRFARHMRAHAYGVISIVGLDAAPRFPIVWIMVDTKVALTMMGEGAELSGDLKRFVARYIGRFFADIEPEVTALRRKLTGGPESLH